MYQLAFVRKGKYEVCKRQRAVLQQQGTLPPLLPTYRKTHKITASPRQVLQKSKSGRSPVAQGRPIQKQNLGVKAYLCKDSDKRITSTSAHSRGLLGSSTAVSPKSVLGRIGSRTKRRLQRLPRELFSCVGTRSKSVSISRTPDGLRTPYPQSAMRQDRQEPVGEDENSNIGMWFGSLLRKSHLRHDSESTSHSSQSSDRDSKPSSLSGEPSHLPAVIRRGSVTSTNIFGEVVKRRRSSLAVPLRTKSVPQDPLALARPPAPVPRESQVHLVKTIRLSKFMKNSWITGMAVTKKNEIVVVDLRGGYLLDEHGSLKKVIGAKSGSRLQEPIDVTVLGNGNIAFSDHADQEVKVYNWKGHYVRKVDAKHLSNIAGVAAGGPDKRDIYIAGTDKQRISVHSEDDKLDPYSIPDMSREGVRLNGCLRGEFQPSSLKEEACKSPLEHPYSLAISSLTGNIIVGDDYKQMVIALSPNGRVLWRFSPTGLGDRNFFPSSICVDNEGYIFVADLYNEKIYMLDSSGKYLKTVLSRDDFLKGPPGAIATDGRGHLLVADEEKTIKVFKYGENGFALYRRFSYCPHVT